MAEAVLEIVLENLNSFIQKELGLLLGCDEDMKRLASLFTTIKATLEDAEEKQFSNRAIKDWLGKLKDAAHILDDIMDEYASEALGLEYQGVKCGLSDKVQSSCLSSFHPKHVVFRYKIAKKMKRIRERLEEIAQERTMFHLTEMVPVPERRSGVIEWRQTISSITEPQVYGREEDMNKIVDYLIGDACNFEDLSVYPIIGLGGLGKTTLAQLVFNHEKVVKHFELRIWICVSEDFSLKRMLKVIIEAVSKRACEDLDLEPLKGKLQDLLQRKRYLLVLDDVWDDGQENWQKLKFVLACGKKGASILVTTRLLKVAAIMGTIPPHKLSVLSDKDCWELFKHRAFGPNEIEDVELVAIGKEIVKKCGGVPLAAKALGSLLRFKREEKEWLSIKESNMWNLSESENSVMPILRLSYLNLPIKLRQCFAYCAIFPKDKIMWKQDLIKLWMANGFISSNETLNAEDVGDDVWRELYWRSFFQDIQKDEFGKVTCFKTHDLIHDLAQTVAEDVACIMDDNGTSTSSQRIHHLSSHSPKGKFDSIKLHQFKSLRTYISNYNADHVLKCSSLRVLHCRRSKELLSSIGHLKHLRYLNLCEGIFKTLPESIGKLWNLQILKLDYCGKLQKLPHSLIHLKSLQQLSLNGCYSLSSLSPWIGKLTSLRSLSTYFVGKERGFLLAELGPLKLKGDLRIKNLEKVKSVMDAKEANMSSKQLNQLWLSWNRNEEELQENAEQILEVLQPDVQQLMRLSVEGYEGGRFPQWMSSPSLKYLICLELRSCKSCLQFPALGKLPSLKSLKIYDMNNVKYLHEEEYFDNGVAFVALEYLSLHRLPNLNGLSREDGKNMFPGLSTLQIDGCPKLLGLPSLPSTKDLDIEGECSQDLLSSIRKLGSLESLFFHGNHKLTHFPDGMLQNLTSLKKLHVHGLSKLEAFPTKIINLNAIQQLSIEDCGSLKLLPQGLHSLKKLEIWGCPMLNLSTGFQSLACLEDLIVRDGTKVEGLLEALQHMTALKCIEIWDHPDLESLPDCFGNLPLLRKLAIGHCRRLTCLPTSLSLSRLHSLHITFCPELEKRCERDTGEDWPKIAHVPDIHIVTYFGPFEVC